MMQGRSDLLPHLSVAVAVLIYALIQIQHFTPAYQEMDPDGYLILAKRMAHLQPLAVKEEDPFMYQSHVWVETSGGGVIPKFAPGYPLLLAILYRIGDDEAMFLVSPLMGGLGLIGAYLLFSLWMSPLAAALGVWVLAVNPMYLIYSGYLLTHASNTCLITWGMYFLWRWTGGHSGRAGIWAGLLLGFAAAIRYTSALMGGVVLIAALSRWLRERDGGNSTLRQIGVLLGCYAVFPILLMIYNWSLFGHPLVTGYALTHEQGAFSLKFFRRNLPMMMGGLNTTALFLVFPLGLAGMMLIGGLWERLMRLFWFLPIVLLYTFYYWASPSMPYLRFTICTFPVVVGSALLLLERASDVSLSLRGRWVHRGVMILFVALIVVLRYNEAQRGMRQIVSDPGSRAVALGARMLSRTLQPDAVIFSQRPFFCYIGTRERFRHYDLQRFKTPLNSSVRRQPKRTERLRKLYASLDHAGKLRKKRQLIRSYLAQGRQVVFFIPQDALGREREELGGDFKFILLKEWEVPIKSPPAKWGIYQIELTPNP
jgi:hypothetical protein